MDKIAGKSDEDKARRGSMGTPWVRLWRGMPTDPKFRAIAKRAGRPLVEVIAVFTVMMTTAADEDGWLTSWNDEDVAAGLDMEPASVEAIRDAMQGKVLKGMWLSSWRKRQPKRDDDSRDRVREWREKRSVTHGNAAVTHGNAAVTHGNAPDSDSDTEKNRTPSSTSECGAAREESGVARQSPIGVGVGLVGGEVSPAAKLRVCRMLGVADVEPLVEIYRGWATSRRARDPDALFTRAAPKLWTNARPEVRERCRPLRTEIEIAPVVGVRASPQLRASLQRGGRHAH